MDRSRTGGRSATVVALRKNARQAHGATVNGPLAKGQVRSERHSALMDELKRTWHFVNGSGVRLATRDGDTVVDLVESTEEHICRRMMQSLGRHWSSKIVQCERDEQTICVLFVWRDDVLGDPVAANDDTLWVLEPGSARIRSAEVESEYGAWTISPKAFQAWLCGNRPVPA